MKTLLGVVLCCLGLTVSATIIPVERIADWSKCGTNVPSANWPIWTNVVNPGGDVSATLTWLSANCPAGQVVKLGPGTWYYGTKLQITRNNIVFRGSPTTLVFTGTLAAVEFLPPGGEFVRNNQAATQTSADLLSGYTRGSTSFTVATAQLNSDFVVGAQIMLDQLNDGTVYPDSLWNGSLVTRYGPYQDGSFTCTYCSRASGTRGMSQTVLITGISSVGGTTTVTIDAPMYFTYLASRSPQVTWWISPANCTGCGIEDMTIDCSNAIGNNSSYLVQFYWAQYCWARNINTILGDRAHYGFNGAYHCVLRDSYMYLSKGNTSVNYGCELNDNACGNLIENNRANACGAPYIFGSQTAGNAFTYNYMTNVLANPTNWMPSAISIHDEHVMFNLIEGNYTVSVFADVIHGSSSHNTVWRNRITGFQTMGWLGVTMTTAQNSFPVTFNNHCKSNNVVGNVIGWPGFTTIYEMTNGVTCNASSTYSAYKFGYFNICDVGNLPSDCPSGIGCNPYDTNVLPSTIIHGNYDYASASQVWDPAIVDHTLPASLIYTNKPTWFGNRPWPPFDPTKTSAAQTDPTNLPAGYQFTYGSPPPPGTGGSGIQGAMIISGSKLQ